MFPPVLHAWKDIPAQKMGEVAPFSEIIVNFFTAFPLLARIGGGKGAVKVMFRHITSPVVVSLGTCSSVATIPTNLHVAKQTGISKDVSEMVISLGATMHMDGSCFACVLKIAFLFGVFGKEFSWDQMIPVVLIAVFSSVGMSGVPGGGYIGEYIVCSIFFPTQMELAFPILVAIGNLVDPIATMINSSGDYAVLFLVSRIVDGKDWLQKKMNRMSLSPPGLRYRSGRLLCGPPDHPPVGAPASQGRPPDDRTLLSALYL